MASARGVAAVLLVGVVAVSAFAVYETYFSGGPPSCLSIQSGGVKTQASESTFGAVAEYKIPGADRWPNAVTTATDGSVWFAEQATPGVAHLFPANGTVVEYAWPGYPRPKPPDCAPWVSINGIAVWNGRIWGADEFGNSIKGVNPDDGSVITVNTTSRADFPYWLAVGPDGALWFTSYSTPARLGKILPDLTMSVTTLYGLGPDEPLQLKFVNSTLAYLSTVDLSTNSTTRSCVCSGHIYSFDPSSAGSSVTTRLVGGSHRLVLPTSVSYSDGTVWVAQHGGSAVAGYNASSGAWTTYPTSSVTWSDVTLPLEVEGSGGRVWFNEHVANKIALLDPVAGTLVEYSESDPPAASEAGIQDDLSIAATSTGVWFTSMSGNYVGFVDAAEDLGLSIAAQGTNHAIVAPGENATFDIRVSGHWSAPLSVNASDSENARSVPTLIRIVSTPSSVEAGAQGPVDLRVNVQVGASLTPGPYTIAVTVTDGGVQLTAYLFIDVA